jgi:hypothetical protein
MSKFQGCARPGQSPGSARRLRRPAEFPPVRDWSKMKSDFIQIILFLSTCGGDMGDILGFTSDNVFPSYAIMGMHTLKVTRFCAVIVDSFE